MTYHPEEYQVTSINYNEDGTIRSFDVNIKGADFIVYRHLHKFKQTKMFLFNEKSKFVEEYDDDGNLIGGKHIEIDWDTCPAGMLHLANQMGLKLKPGIISVTGHGRLTYFVERDVEA